MGRYFNPPTSLTATQFSSARTSKRYLYEISDPLATEDAAGTDTNYAVGSIIRAAKQDLTDTSTTKYYMTNDGNFVLPAADGNGQCSDAGYMRYLYNGISTCRRTADDLPTACTSGGIFSGSRYLTNLKVGTIRTASPALTTQYVGLRVGSVYSQASDGTLTLLGGDTDTTTFTVPEPSWDAATCTCSNVLQAVTYNMTYQPGGQISSTSVPTATAILTTISRQ